MGFCLYVVFRANIILCSCETQFQDFVWVVFRLFSWDSCNSNSWMLVDLESTSRTLYQRVLQNWCWDFQTYTILGIFYPNGFIILLVSHIATGTINFVFNIVLLGVDFFSQVFYSFWFQFCNHILKICVLFFYIATLIFQKFDFDLLNAFT